MAQRAISVETLDRTKFKTLALNQTWIKHIGTPEANGVWMVSGDTGNGKTSYMLQMCKELCNHGKTAYDTLEEGARRSFQLAIREHNMKAVARKFVILDREPMSELMERLRKRKSPDFVVVDSAQYTFLTLRQYYEVKEEAIALNKLLIFVSHVDGNKPEGRLARRIEYDADVKIRVEGFRAFAKSRFGGGAPYTIWAQGAEEYWGINKQNHDKNNSRNPNLPTT